MHQNIYNKKSNICLYCDKIFTRNTSLNRHLSNNICKIKKEQESEKNICLKN